MTGDLAPRLILKNTQPNIREKEILKVLIGNLHYYEYSLSRMKVFCAFTFQMGESIIVLAMHRPGPVPCFLG